MSDLYLTHNLDPENVSVHSTFICLLHLANENNLIFEQTGTDAYQREQDFCIY